MRFAWRVVNAAFLSKDQRWHTSPSYVIRRFVVQAFVKLIHVSAPSIQVILCSLQRLSHEPVTRSYMPLSRRLDRCDRMIQTSPATQTPVMCVCFQRRRVRHNANYVPYAQIPACRNVRCTVTYTSPLKTNTYYADWVASLTLDCNGVFAIKAYCDLYVAFETIAELQLPSFHYLKHGCLHTGIIDNPVKCACADPV